MPERLPLFDQTAFQLFQFYFLGLRADDRACDLGLGCRAKRFGCMTRYRVFGLGFTHGLLGFKGYDLGDIVFWYLFWYLVRAFGLLPRAHGGRPKAVGLVKVNLFLAPVHRDRTAVRLFALVDGLLTEVSPPRVFGLRNQRSCGATLRNHSFEPSASAIGFNAAKARAPLASLSEKPASWSCDKF